MLKKIRGHQAIIWTIRKVIEYRASLGVVMEDNYPKNRDELEYVIYEAERIYRAAVDIRSMTQKLRRTEKNKKWRSLAVSNRNIAAGNLNAIDKLCDAIALDF